ncbi:MAG: sulfatase-like hydrolase/transferase [Lentisphaerales bacterium]|nr:sulfatase-like hydrolase/transferase [Lentisphaerales bacterium]
MNTDKSQLLAILLFSLTAFSWSSQKPNIIFILTDDQGVNDVSCYGSEIPTPHIDSLAHEGAKFDNFYVASSICTPSRFAFLTGQYPSRSQDELTGALMYLGDKKRGIRRHETTIATALQKADYETALIGKWHLGHGHQQFLPTQHGFETFKGHTGGCVDFYTMRYGNEMDWYDGEKLVDRSGYATDIITDDAVAYIKSPERKKKPFFMLLAYNAPHYGKGWDDGSKKAINIMQPPPEALERVSSIKDITRRKFAAKVVNMDDGIGRVLEALDLSSQKDNTLVIFVTDHGGDPKYGGSNLPLRGLKAGLFEGGIRVPCLMRWPAKIKAGTKVTANISALDFFPTFCEMAGIQLQPYKPDGVSIMQTLTGNQQILDRELFFELGRHITFAGKNWYALRKGPWKYIQNDNQEEFLFNISQDPYEQKNKKDTYPEIFAKMKERTLKLAREYQACRPEDGQ